MTIEVEFRDIADAAGCRVGSDGSIWSRWRRSKLSDRWKKLSPVKAGKGYLLVRLFTRNGRFSRYVHRLVLSAFVGPPPEGMEACHLNGNRSDNRLKNLRWDTRSGNHLDKRKHGTNLAGEKNHNAKLTSAEVIQMRALYNSGTHDTNAIAALFRINRKHAWHVVTGRSWQQLDCDQEGRLP